MSLPPSAPLQLEMPVLSPNFPPPNLRFQNKAHPVMPSPMPQPNPHGMIQNIWGSKQINQPMPLPNLRQTFPNLCQTDINVNHRNLFNNMSQSPHHSHLPMLTPIAQPKQNENRRANILPTDQQLTLAINQHFKNFNENILNNWNFQPSVSQMPNQRLLTPRTFASPPSLMAQFPGAKPPSIQSLLAEITKLHGLLADKDRTNRLQAQRIRELRTELCTGIRTNQEIRRIVADRDRHRLAVRFHKRKIRRMMRAQALLKARSQGRHDQCLREGFRAPGIRDRPSSSSAHPRDDCFPTAIIQRSGERFEPLAGRIQKLEPNAESSPEQTLNGFPVPPREDANGHISRPEVQKVYRYLNGNFACLYNPRKHAFPQTVCRIPPLKVLIRYEKQMTGRNLPKYLAQERYNELVAEQINQTGKVFIEVMTRSEQRRRVEDEEDDE